MTPTYHAINYVEITVTDMDTAQHFYGTAFALSASRNLVLVDRRAVARRKRKRQDGAHFAPVAGGPASADRET
jgi:predicted enzyme related to lactoylglutathione lyase